MFSNYCGPGGKGKTQHQTDIECKKHDIAYEVALQLGGDPYWRYIKGDTEFLKKLISTPAKSFKEHAIKELSSVFAAVKHLLPGDQVEESKFELLEKDSNWQINYNGDTITMPNKKLRTGYFQSEASRLRRGERQARLSERFNEEFGHLKHTSPDDVSQGERSSLPNIPPFPELESTMRDEDEDMGVASASRSMGGSKTINNEETPITMATPSYQLQETHTTILPVTFYGSAVLESNKATDLTLRLSDPLNPLVTTFVARPGNQTTTGTPTASSFIGNLGAPFTQNLYNSKIKTHTALVTNAVTSNSIGINSGNNSYAQGEAPNSSRWTVSQAVFPDQLAAGAQPEPRMYDWYKSMYDWYTVLGTEYEIVFQHTSVSQSAGNYGNNDVVIAEVMDISSNTPENDGNKIPNQSKLSNLQYYKNIKYHSIKAPNINDNNTPYYTIKGSYKPGSAKGLIENDGDIKRWIKTGLPNTMYEDLHLMLFPSPFNTVHNQPVNGFIYVNPTTPFTNGSENAKTSLNFKITLKYIVQYKDLKTFYRYPDVDEVGDSLTYTEYVQHKNQTKQ